MKKVTILLSLSCVFSKVCGVYSEWTRNELRKRSAHTLEKAMSEIASSSNVKFSDQKHSKNRFSKIIKSTDTNSEMRKKIRNFSRNLKSNIYSEKQVEDALVECLPFSKHSETSIVKNFISPWTLARWISELGLNEIYKDQKSKKAQEKLIASFEQNVEWKNIHQIIGKKRNASINALRKLQDKGLIRVVLDEEKKSRLIKDFREKLITHKGLACKYKIKESEVYCIIHEARTNKKDLSLINIDWKIRYKNRKALSKKRKEKIVKDYNKGLLTLKGICVKHGTSQKIAQSIIYENNNKNIKRRHGIQRKINPELVLDVRTKSSQEIERKYGYTSVYVDELKRFVNQWNMLTDDQKNMFIYTIFSGIMPTENELSSVNSSLYEKFGKILFVSVSTVEDVMAEYGIQRRSVSRLVRELEFWKILSAEEQKKRFLPNLSKSNDDVLFPLTAANSEFIHRN